MTEEKEAWWAPISLLTILIAIGMDILVWKYSEGSEFSFIAGRMILGFTMSFGVTSFALLLVSLGAVHRYARWQEQVVGLTLLAALGLCLTYWQLDNSMASMRSSGVIILAGATAMLAAAGLVFGLLLALVTGREHIPDPLLEMDSTGGDVSVELEA
jgi:hypothetical protein